MENAVKKAKDYISGALAAMLDLGQGQGPMDHGYVLDKKDIEVNDRESDSDTYYGLKIKSKTESGSNVFVSGIDSLYVNHFEKINVVKGSEEGLNKVLNENANSYNG